MKRSEAIKLIESVVSEANWELGPIGLYTYANEILIKLEESGMLPPEANDFNIGNRWEPEEGK